MLHVVDKEFMKITSHNPSRTLGVGQRRRIALCLLIRREHSAVALLDGFAQVFVLTLLLNHNMCCIDIGINKTSFVELNLFLKVYVFLRLPHAIHLAEQCKPECLALTFLIAFAAPLVGKSHSGGCLCLFLVHIVVLFPFSV